MYGLYDDKVHKKCVRILLVLEANMRFMTMDRDIDILQAALLRRAFAIPQV